MTDTLSNKIKQARFGAAHNPYQGSDKKVLFVCSMGILRSATASRIYAKKYNTRSAGTFPEALVPLSPILLEWANEIVFVNEENYYGAVELFGEEPFKRTDTKVLNIPDHYDHMHPELVKAFEDQYEPLS